MSLAFMRVFVSLACHEGVMCHSPVIIVIVSLAWHEGGLCHSPVIAVFYVTHLS